MERKFTELEKIRRAKIDTLLEKGINPYARNIKFEDNSNTLEEKYNKYSKEELHEMNKVTSVSFRILTKRGPFLVGEDAFGPIQAYAGKDIKEEVAEVKDLLDIGDIIWVEGPVMKTNTGALTIKAENLKLVTKSLKPLPEKFHGLKDVEEKYRRRYVDLIMNKETRETFWKRTKIVSGIREYFDTLGYMEADTPILSALLTGAAARPFITNHNALDMDFYLRIATELPLKRLLVGGLNRVYEIGRLFRNEGIDTSHNPEFTTIEFYEAYSNLDGMMERTENLFGFLAKKLNITDLKYNGKDISLKVPFARLEMTDAVSKAVGTDMKKVTFEEAKEIAKKHNIKVEPFFKTGHIINELFEELIESTIVQPTFVYGHPIEISPFAAIDENDKRFTERAELFIDGREYANMFTELNDPIDQMERFESQLEESNKGNDEANEIDVDFVEALEYGMPPAGGCGVGIDRLVMLLTGKQSIRDVLLFPHLKNK